MTSKVKIHPKLLIFLSKFSGTLWCQQIHSEISVVLDNGS